MRCGVLRMNHDLVKIQQLAHEINDSNVEIFKREKVGFNEAISIYVNLILSACVNIGKVDEEDFKYLLTQMLQSFQENKRKRDEQREN